MIQDLHSITLRVKTDGVDSSIIYLNRDYLKRVYFAETLETYLKAFFFSFSMKQHQTNQNV